MLKIDLFIQEENGPQGIGRYILNRKDRNINRGLGFSFFLNNDQLEGLNSNCADFEEDLLKNWITDLL